MQGFFYNCSNKNISYCSNYYYETIINPGFY